MNLFTPDFLSKRRFYRGVRWENYLAHLIKTQIFFLSPTVLSPYHSAHLFLPSKVEMKIEMAQNRPEAVNRVKGRQTHYKKHEVTT